MVAFIDEEQNNSVVTQLNIWHTHGIVIVEIIDIIALINLSCYFATFSKL